MSTFFNPSASFMELALFGFFAIITISFLALAFYLVFSSISSAYRYNKFSLPVEKELIIGLGEQEQKIVDAMEVTKFNIGESVDDELIAESREVSKHIHEEEIRLAEERKAQEIKRMKKELAKKNKKEKK